MRFLKISPFLLENGLWETQLPPVEAGGPYTISFTSVVNASTVVIILQSVLFGDVWLCSGQSNMEFHVEQVSLDYYICNFHIADFSLDISQIIFLASDV